MANATGGLTVPLRYCMTGVFTDYQHSGMVEEYETTYLDPVVAALEYLGATNGGFRTVLLEAAAPGEPFRAHFPRDLISAAHLALGRDLDGTDLTTRHDTAPGNTLYKHLVQAQADCLDRFLRPLDDDPSYHPAAPESLADWKRAGRWWAFEVGGVPSRDVLDAVVARYRDWDPEGLPHLLEQARSMEALLRAPQDGIDGDDTQRLQTLRTGWQELHFAGWGIDSPRQQAIERWWIDQMAALDPRTGPVLASVNDRPRLAELVRDSAARVVRWSHIDNPDRDRQLTAEFTAQVEALLAEDAQRAQRPDDQDPGAELLPGWPRLRDARAYAEHWRLRAPRSRTREAEENHRLTRSVQAIAEQRYAPASQDRSWPPPPTRDQLLEWRSAQEGRVRHLQRWHTVMGALLEVQDLQEEITQAREAVQQRGWEAADQARQAALAQGTPPGLAAGPIAAEALAQATEPLYAAFEAVLHQQRIHARQIIEQTLPQAGRSPRDYHRALLEAIGNPTSVYAQQNVHDAHEAAVNAQRAAADAERSLHRPNTRYEQFMGDGPREPMTQGRRDVLVARAAERTEHAAATSREFNMTRHSLKALDGVLEQQPARYRVHDDGSDRIHAHARELAAGPATTPITVRTAAAVSQALREQRQAAVLRLQVTASPNPNPYPLGAQQEKAFLDSFTSALPQSPPAPAPCSDTDRGRTDQHRFPAPGPGQTRRTP